MTLILSLTNTEYTVQVSDRRLTAGSRVMTDEAPKATVLTCDDARFVIGFTGLASAGAFNTQRWMLATLADMGGKGITQSQGLISGLKAELTEQFRRLRVEPAHKRLTVLVTGFRYADVADGIPEGRLAAAILTNFQDLRGNEPPSPVARDEFEVRYEQARPDWPGEPTHVQVVGAFSAVRQGELDELRTMLERRLPARSVAERAINVVRRAAASAASAGTVGNQLMVTTASSDVHAEPSGQYVTAHNSLRNYAPDRVLATSSLSIALSEPLLEAVSPGSRPLSVPAVPRKWPCPCGSGQRYGDCHGRFPRQRRPRNR